jgi:O-antigen ligase
VAASLPGLFALAATFTRSAWIGMSVALAMMLGVARPRALPILAGALALAVVLAPPAYRARIASAFDPAHVTNRERTYMWSAGLRMFQDHPITGVGLQDLKPIYARYRSPEAHEAAGHLHSVPVQIAATMGTVGLVAFGALWAGLFVLAGAGVRRMPRERDVERAFRIGALGALAGFLVAGLFEWNLGDEELLYTLFVLAGLSWSAWRATPEGSASGARDDARLRRTRAEPSPPVRQPA